MIPRDEDLMHCIIIDGAVADGAFGLAIAATEADAWARLLDPCDEWSIRRAKGVGYSARRCALMVINP